MNFTCNGTNQNHVLDRMPWKEHGFASGRFLPMIHNLNLIMRKHQTNSHWKTFYEITAIIFKCVKVIETSKNCSRWRRLKGHDNENALCDSEPDAFALKGIWQKVTKLKWGLRITWWSNINVISWFWLLYCGYKRECPYM